MAQEMVGLLGERDLLLRTLPAEPASGMSTWKRPMRKSSAQTEMNLDEGQT